MDPSHWASLLKKWKFQKNSFSSPVSLKFSETHQDYSLIIAGKIGGEYAEEMQKLAETLGIAPRVRFLGYVTDGELAYLYSRAVALAFPSLVEGFGMPVLEAMERGLPVITSNAGALAEVAGGAAVLVDPYNPSDIARAMNLLVENPAVRQEYIEKGRRRAREFSWEKNSREFVELINTL
jgi:glycosyltransferase involved in cell wall biosynthesis